MEFDREPKKLIHLFLLIFNKLPQIVIVFHRVRDQVAPSLNFKFSN